MIEMNVIVCSIMEEKNKQSAEAHTNTYPSQEGTGFPKITLTTAMPGLKTPKDHNERRLLS